MTGEILPGDWFASRKRRAAVAAGVVILTALLFLGRVFEPAEDRLTELRSRLLDRAPTGETVIVEIDARSLARLDSWPWPRRHHAAALRALRAAGTELIAFDVDFSARSSAADDAAFARALHDTGPVILPVFQQIGSGGEGQDLVVRSRPNAAFRESWIGGVNIFPGSDGKLRDYPAATWIGGKIQPSLATLLADNHGWKDQSFAPDWSIDARRIPRVSFVDLLEGRVATARLAGKRVIVGATAIELGDRYAVPRFGVLPGVVVQALAAESLLQNRGMVRIGTLPTLLGTIALTLGLLLPRFSRFAVSFPPVAVVCIGALAMIPIAIQSWFPVLVDSAAMLFAALVGVLARVGGEIRRRVVARTCRDVESGLPNRRMLESRLAALSDGDGPGLVAAAAIERFATIRDAIGTDASSALMRAIAERLSPLVGGPIYRLAPDIVAWIDPAVDRAELAETIEAVSRAFRSPLPVGPSRVDVTLTVGIDPVECDAPIRTIERALSAIGAARDARVGWRFFEGANAVVQRDISLMGDLRQAMADGQIRLAYQPKLNLRSGAITDAEALVRWHHPEEGMIPPDRFIPLAEATGVVRELTLFVLRAALQDCARWRASGVEMRIAVNVSAADLVTRDFAAVVVRLLAETGVSPASLALEVTESAYVSSPHQAIEVLKTLRMVGIRLSIDDYGTGQSTLSYLKQFPVHELKIDKSFITALTADRNDAIMVGSTIELAHRLGLAVVAEGIEEAETLDLLAELGCDYAQGYFIGKPMTFEALSELCVKPVCRAA